MKIVPFLVVRFKVWKNTMEDKKECQKSDPS
jgi:hypothetical protein